MVLADLDLLSCHLHHHCPKTTVQAFVERRGEERRGEERRGGRGEERREERRGGRRGKEGGEERREERRGGSRGDKEAEKERRDGWRINTQKLISYNCSQRREERRHRR